MISSKKESTSCEQINVVVDNITEGIEIVAILDNTSMCACCGKEGYSDNMNTCNKCKSARYCNAACKKKHRTKHKKACEKRVAELHDEQLFKEVEPEECPICMQPLQCGNKTEIFKPCCGKVICAGCIYTMKMSKGKDICAFCRRPTSSAEEEIIGEVKKLMEAGNADAFDMFAGWYDDGKKGLPQDHQKAMELFLKAGELGCSIGYYNLGNSYHLGDGVEKDDKKANYYYELAAMSGDVDARYSLGVMECWAGNYDRAMRHFVLAAKAGHKTALDDVKQGYEYGLVTKDEYINTLRAHQQRLDEMKSDARDKAAALVLSHYGA